MVMEGPRVALSVAEEFAMGGFVVSLEGTWPPGLAYGVVLN